MCLRTESGMVCKSVNDPGIREKEGSMITLFTIVALSLLLFWCELAGVASR